MSVCTYYTKVSDLSALWDLAFGDEVYRIGAICVAIPLYQSSLFSLHIAGSHIVLVVWFDVRCL